MKTLFTIILLTICFDLSAQIGGERIDTAYHCKDGRILHPDDTIHFGSGTLPNGGFKYIYIPANGFAGTPQESASSQYSGYHSQIKFFKKQGSKKLGYKTLAVINTGGFNLAIDIEQAIKAGEIEF